MDIAIIATHIWFGFITSFLGSLPVGMINVTAVEVTVSRGYSRAFLFSVGASLVELLQAFVALYFLQYLLQVPELDFWFMLISIPLFLAIGINYWRQKSEVKQHEITGRGPGFWRGVGISSLNILTYPYWILWGSIYMSRGVLINETPFIAIFALGTGIGTFTALCVYVLGSTLLLKHINQFNRVANKVVGSVFFLLAAYLIFLVVRDYTAQ
jgi:threonine/homoserine/homoserine lactone efflux protein